MRIRPVPAIALALGTASVAALLTLATQTSGAIPAADQDPSTCAIPPSRSGQVPDPSAAGAEASFYPGPSASDTYDAQWTKAFRIPHLDSYVPQGMTTWQNWNGEGDDLVLIGLYRGRRQEGQQSIIAAVDPRTGEHYAGLRVRHSHLGGIAVVGEFLLAQDQAARNAEETVRRYRLSSIRAAVVESNRTRDLKFVGMLREVQEIHSADFMTVHGDRLWAGRYSEHEPTEMFEYAVDARGKLTPLGAGWPIPPRTQGALVTDTAFVFNSSNHLHHGVMVLTERSRAAERRTVCFASPSMGEGMTLIGDRALNLFEGGSFKYPKALNRITDVHEASMRSLAALLDR